MVQYLIYNTLATLAMLLLTAKSSIAGSNGLPPDATNEPCTDGWCAWAGGDGKKQQHSTLIVNGAETALSDVTSTAGWKISGCPQSWDKGEMTITMMCIDPSKCTHVFKGGVEDTLVRLPEECGKGPFARIMKCSITGKQSDNENITAGMQWDATISYDFNSKPPDASKGPIKFYLVSSNVKSAAKVLDKRWAQEYRRKRGREKYLHQRGLFDSIAHGLDSAAKFIKDGAETIGAVTGKLSSFNDTSEKNLGTVPIKKNFTIFNKTFNCGAFSADIDLGVDADLEAQVAFGHAFVGQLLPPKITELSAHATLNGQLLATFNLDIGVHGKFDTGVINLATIPLTPLTIAGIINIGPEASLGAELTAEIDIEAHLSIDTSFDLPNINLVFPPSAGKSSGGQTKHKDNPNPLKVSVGAASLQARGQIDAHLIPRIDVGIDLIDVFKATIFLELDASGSVILTLDAEKDFSPSTTSVASSNAIAASSPAIVKSSTSSLPSSTNVASSVTDAPKSKDKTKSSKAKGGATSSSKPPSKTGSPTQKGSQAKKTTSSNNKNPTSVAINRTLTGKRSPVSRSNMPARARAATSNGKIPISPADTKLQVQPNTALTKPKSKRASPAMVSGSVELDISIFMNGGLEGAIIGLFDQSITFPIFNVTIPLFKKNFGTPRSRSLDSSAEVYSLYLEQRDEPAAKAPADTGGLSCFFSGSGSSGKSGVSSLLSLPL